VEPKVTGRKTRNQHRDAGTETGFSAKKVEAISAEDVPRCANCEVHDMVRVLIGQIDTGVSYVVFGRVQEWLGDGWVASLTSV